MYYWNKNESGLTLLETINNQDKSAIPIPFLFLGQYLPEPACPQPPRSKFVDEYDSQLCHYLTCLIARIRGWLR